MTRFVPIFAALLLIGALAPPVPAQEEPLTAGSGGVPVPKRAKTVPPEYPAEAQAQGIRGIVILELIIDKAGRVTEARTVRSVPGLDEAALTAARQWTYEVTKVDGKPVSVRLTVPITFAMKLPEITRQEGIPELRQGVVPRFPPDAKGPATVVVAATLDAEGRVAEAQAVEGEAPWTNALMAALRTWRFAAEAAEVTLSFRVQADFIPGEKKEPGRVALRLDGVRRSESVAGEAPPATVPAPTPPAVAPPATPQAPPAAPSVPVAASTPAPPADAPPAGSSARVQAPPAGNAAPPPVEVITAPPPAAAPPEPENGTSALRDVVLEAGVPDLTKGRRPVPPPFARMSATGGTVEVQFSVSAGGACTVQSTSGPDLLKAAAQQTVTSWQFRRTQVQRLFLTALFRFEGDKATAVVRPQAQPPAPQP